ncbi:uncharacterized protein TNCV_1487521 [Trichonephila clavipes]|nr:uncharacterized protein TNCV_1487521 [Trichonephila clavipes]
MGSHVVAVCWTNHKSEKKKSLGRIIKKWSPTGIVLSEADCFAVGTGGTLNNRQAASPLVWLVEGEERMEVPVHPQGFLPLNWGGTEQNRTVTCMVLKAKTNDRRKNSSL